MGQVYPFFIIIFAAVVFSSIFRRLHFPWVITLIIAGVAIGPSGLNIYQSDPVINFLSEIGLVFLMFMAGLETSSAGIKKIKKEITIISLVNGLLPFIVGISIGLLLGYHLLAATLLGVIFISSSIAVVIPSLESRGLLSQRIGKIIVSSAVLEDAASLVVLSVLIQATNPVTVLPLPLFYALLLFTLLFLRSFLPKLQDALRDSRSSKKDIFQHELRIVLGILLGTVIVFEVLGLHPIIAGFFAGFVLSNSISHELLKEKLRTISYGLFIPTFFLVTGAQVGLGSLTTSSEALIATVLIVSGAISAKFFSGLLGGKLAGLTHSESLLVGISTTPQLSTTLAVVTTGAALGILDPDLVTSMIILSIVSVLFAPLLLNRALSK